MKICPVCQKTYDDEYLNFCLEDGATLEQGARKDDAPPTVLLNQARATNEMNWRDTNQQQQQQSTPFSAPISPWQNSSMQPQTNQNQMYSPPSAYARGGQDQTLPIVSVVLGVLGLVFICCYGGFPFGIAAIITGYLGLNNTNKNPMRYGGRGMAIAGLILGAVSLLTGLLFILLAIIGNL
jgi:hypothetical protein